jgi:aryl-alcohol dehydrogenase (NADP+)
LLRVVSVGPLNNLLWREIEREHVPLAQEDSIAVMPFNPLVGTFLSER